MGRSEEIWGEDYMEFKPERWISEVGKVVQKPASMYFPFGVGARACVGKDLSLKMMKTVAINVLRNYEVKVVESQRVVMTYGFLDLALNMRLGTEVDLEDVLGRFQYDYMCLLALWFDPKTLSVELPVVEIAEALGDIDGAMVYRNVVPQKIWKLQKWLQIGTEKKLVNELRIVDYVLYRFISSRRDELRRSEAKAGDRLDV
ncbi:hypothetical protein V6N13_032868 [Hibiscus sabdariffa]